MTKRIPALLLAFPLLLLVPPARGAETPAAGPWKTGPFDNAMSEGLGRQAVVDVVAGWCGPCRQMEKEIWSQPEGAEILRGRFAYRVDFDTPAGQDVKRRYNVIGLPTVIFLDEGGIEIDRISGYEDKAKWLAEARRYLSGRNRKQELEAAAEKAPDDPKALVELGAFVLQRGDTVRGIGLLERAVEKDPRNEKGFSDDALFYLGRYYTRVAEDPVSGMPVWKRLWTDYPDGDLAGGAPYWFLLSCESRRALPAGLEEAKSLLQAHPSRDATLSVASFLAERPEWRSEAMAVIRLRMKAGQELDADLLALAGRIQHERGLPDIARRYAERALQADPEHAGAKELLGKLGATSPAPAGS